MKKYKLTNNVINHDGRILHQIEALRSFGKVKRGDRGGWLEKEENLSQDGLAWVFEEAKVFGNARVFENAWVCGDARVCGEAWVCGEARVYGDAWVCGDAMIGGKADVYYKLMGGEKKMINRFIDDFIDAIRRGDVGRIIGYYVTGFILLGVILLALTYLGGLGIIIALAVIAYVIFAVILTQWIR